MNETNKQTNKYKWAADYLRENYILSCDECNIDTKCLLISELCKKDHAALKLAIRILEIAAMYTSKESENLKDALDRGELNLNE